MIQQIQIILITLISGLFALLACASFETDSNNTDPEIEWTYIGMNHTETDVNGEDWIGNHHTDIEHSIQRSQNGNIYRFEVHQGEGRPGRDPNVERAELGGRTKYAYGDEIWIAYSVNMLPGEKPDSRWLVTGQLHGSISSPPMAILGNRDSLMVESRFGTVSDRDITIHYATPWVRGEWYDLVIRLKAGINNDAILQVWLNGEQVVDETEHFNMGYIDDYGNIRPNLSENPVPLYWKYGIYRQSAPQVQSTKVANMEIGTNSLLHRVDNPKPIIP